MKLLLKGRCVSDVVRKLVLRRFKGNVSHRPIHQSLPRTLAFLQRDSKYVSRHFLTYILINRYVWCLVGQERDGGSVHTSLYMTDSRFDLKSSETVDPTLPPSYSDLPPRRQRSESAPSYDTLFPDVY